MNDQALLASRKPRWLWAASAMTKVDVLALVLTIVAAFAITRTLRAKINAAWQEQTSGTSSPYEFRHKLMSANSDDLSWLFISFESPSASVCTDFPPSDSGATVRLRLILVGAVGGPLELNCNSGKAEVSPVRDGQLWNTVLASMKAAGARAVIVDPSGEVVYSSRESRYPAAIVSILSIPRDTVQYHDKAL